MRVTRLVLHTLQLLFKSSLLSDACLFCNYCTNMSHIELDVKYLFLFGEIDRVRI